jgi:hypothetical protein
MTTRNMVFGRFRVAFDGNTLVGQAWGRVGRRGKTPACSRGQGGHIYGP